MKLRLLPLFALATIAPASHAASTFSANINNTELEVVIPGFGSASESDTGFGARAEFFEKASTGLYGGFEYSSTDIEGLKVSQLRLKVGTRNEINSEFTGVLEANFGQIKADSEKDDGFILKAGFEIPNTAVIYGDIGVVVYDELDGTEITFGVKGDVAESSIAYLEYRITNTEDDFGAEFNLSGITAGFGMKF